MKITVKSTGNFNKTIELLNGGKEISNFDFLEEYGKKGVKSLSNYTPKDSGLTSESWEYSISKKRNHIILSFLNTNIQDGVNIAILIQNGHATKNGMWVEGLDYVNPAIQPIFTEIIKRIREEVESL